jgi:hypothetical protein
LIFIFSYGEKYLHTYQLLPVKKKMSNTNNIDSKNDTKDGKEGKEKNSKYLNDHIQRMKEYNKGMKKYEEAQQHSKETGGFAKFEDVLPGGIFYEEDD